MRNIKRDHISHVTDLSSEFQQYLKELHRGDEADRAERTTMRLDHEDDTKD